MTQRAEVPRHAGEGRGLRPAGPARGRDPSARPRPRRQHEHAARHAPVDRRSAGRGRHRDVPLQLPLLGERQGPRLAGRLHGDVRSAVAAAHEAAPDLPLLAGGHSFGGRMTSTAASESPLEGVRGLVFFSFPLHLAGKPETKRADHLADVTVPMLFLSGTRDELADLDLLRPVCEKLGEPRDAPSPRHGRPRLQDPQEVPHQRRGRLRRDGPRRSGLGGETGEQEARMKIATYNVNSINARLPVLLHWLASVEARRRLPAGAEDDRREVPGRRHPRGGLRGRLARPEGVERRRHPRPGREARGDPARPARRPGRHPQPLHRGRRGRRDGRLPLPAQRQPGPGPEVRLQAEVVRAAHTPTPRACSRRAARSSSRATTTSSRPSGTSTSPSGGSTTPCSCPRPARPTGDCSPRAGRTALRHLHPDETIYTFWDYMRGAFSRNAGLRIDHLLLSPELAPRLKAAGVDKDVRAMEKTSDHAPTWVEV